MPDVVLPVLNEAGALAGVLARLPTGYRAIVVDNGSTDGSGAIARANGATVIHEPTRGFGAACFAGLRAATEPIVCFMDCDGSFDSAELPGIVAPILAGEADLSLGSRTPRPGAWPVHARVANRALAAYIRRSTGIMLEDLGPMRAARRLDLLDLGIEDRRFGWPLEMVLRAHQRGWQIVENPVTYSPRIGSSKVTGTVRGTFRAVKDMSDVIRTVGTP